MDRSSGCYRGALRLAVSFIIAIALWSPAVMGQCVTNELAKLTASDAEAGDEFGRAVAISGDIAVFGARREGADPMGDPIGACCLPDGSCIVVMETQCQIQGGTYQGDDATCDDANCPALGACCIPFDICEVATIQECFGELGGAYWAPEQDCVTFTCPPLGACCRPDGTCQITGQSSCENTANGTYQGDGVTCQGSACPQPCPADLDGDGMVGAVDLAMLLGSWGPCRGCPADLDGDGNVGTNDLAGLLGDWGPCP